MSTQHAAEIQTGARFAFGENWARFLAVLNDDRIHQAEQSLCTMLKVKDLRGKRFLDAGSGSGLFSLAARRLGATVHSFDYDPQSVACTEELKRRYFLDDKDWRVEPGSVLDRKYLDALGQWDVVYSWGVLHHTGNMAEALDNVSKLAGAEGVLFIAIYNDQGGKSRRWRLVKQTYNRLPKPWKPLFAFLIMLPRELLFLAAASLKGKPWLYFDNIVNYAERSTRGMSYWHDLIDWVGGMPFEVATPEHIFRFYRDRGFRLEELTTCAGGIACNEFVFRRT